MATTPVCKKGFLMVVVLSVISLVGGCSTVHSTKGCMDEPLRHYVIPGKEN